VEDTVASFFPQATNNVVRKMIAADKNNFFMYVDD